MDRVEKIRSRINEALTPIKLEIQDDSYQHAGHAGTVSGGGHFSVTIVSDKFVGKNMIERHRAVYLAVNDMMPAEIHALSIKALTPDEI
jgi:BolA family transcriptional regulator, general stress-responsive regulator